MTINIGRMAILAAALALAGCSTVGKFDNVLVVSLTGDRAFVSSLYGPIGITAELRQADAQALAEMARARDLIATLRAQYAAKQAEEKAKPAPSTLQAQR